MASADSAKCLSSGSPLCSRIQFSLVTRKTSCWPEYVPDGAANWGALMQQCCWHHVMDSLSLGVSLLSSNRLREERIRFAMNTTALKTFLVSIQDELDKLLASLQTLKQRKACSVSSTMASRIGAIQEAFR